MDCREIERFLDHYLDGEFASGDAAALEEHLHLCPGCRRLALAELHLREGLRRQLNPPPALSPALRDRLVSAALSRVPRGVRWRDLFRPVILAPAGAALTAALLLTLWVAWPSDREFDRFIDHSILAHESALPAEVEGDEAAITRYVRERARFDARPPLDSAEARLVGARLTNLGAAPAVQYRYLVEGHPISVLQVPISVADSRARGLEAAVRFVGDRGRLGVSVFEDGGLQNAAVGDLPARDLVRLVPASY